MCLVLIDFSAISSVRSVVHKTARADILNLDLISLLTAFHYYMNNDYHNSITDTGFSRHGLPGMVLYVWRMVVC